MTLSLFLSTYLRRGLEISQVPVKHFDSFPPCRCWPTIWPGIYFWSFKKKFAANFFFIRRVVFTVTSPSRAVDKRWKWAMNNFPQGCFRSLLIAETLHRRSLPVSARWSPHRSWRAVRRSGYPTFFGMMYVKSRNRQTLAATAAHLKNWLTVEHRKMVWSTVARHQHIYTIRAGSSQNPRISSESNVRVVFGR